MADIAPFRGILYSPNAGDPSKLLAPPYDVISDADRANLSKLDPHNCVRLILPEADPKDGKDADARYGRAAADFNAWLGDGTLKRDAAPAIYRYHQTFDVNGKEITRRGFIARVRLVPFSDGVILPHERTLAGPKADRLKLMRATKAHFSQIFGLYADPRHRTDELFETVEKNKPDLAGTTTDGVVQQLWRLTDGAAQKALIDYMSSEKVYIADGHHRYETMLALSGELCEAKKDGPPVTATSAARYGVMFFCNMDDPGLVVLPTHRVLHGLPQFDRTDVLRRATEFFKIMEGPMAGPASLRAALVGHGKKAPTIAMLTPGASTVAYLRLRGDLIKSSVPALADSKALADVDVTLLHSLLLEIILGVTREAQEKQTHLRYVKDMEHAVQAVDEPGVQAVFLLNPTLVSQLRAVADEGQVMPQKSTFFYPKIASGLVMNPIDPAEEIELPN